MARTVPPPHPLATSARSVWMPEQLAVLGIGGDPVPANLFGYTIVDGFSRGSVALLEPS
jgi:hypothetical protein